MKKHIHFKSVMNTLYASVVIIPLIIISLVAVNFTRSYIVDISKDYNEQVINNLKVNIESFFAEHNRQMNGLRELLAISEDEDHNAIIQTVFENQKLFHHILYIDNEGSVVNTYPKEEDIAGFDFSREPSFSAIQNGAIEAWSTPYFYTRENLVSVNYAIPAGDMTLLGVVHLNLIEDIFKDSIYDDDLIVAITDQNGVYIMHTDYTFVEQRETDIYANIEKLNFKRLEINAEDYFATSTTSSKYGWKFIIYEPVSNLQDKLMRYLGMLVLLILGLVIISIFVGYKFNKIIYTNLSTVIAKTKEVEEGRYLIEKDESAFHEFNEISKTLKSMALEIKSREDQILNQSYEIELMNKELETRVNARTNELYSTNQELEITLENLKRTQDQLVESEKLASLGDLVAGLAHEINTPLGVILTIVTYLQESTEKVKEHYDKGLLKKGDFEEHLNSTLESEGLIYDNINRAIELISSFKLISADKQNVEKKQIIVSEFMGNIIKSLMPQMKKSNVMIELHCPEVIEMTTIPLSLYQVIVNLVMNTKVHAYDSDGGLVDISVHKKNQGVEIIVEDYGKGISSENIKKIFEPFYTTKRGDGGTGLGLNIVYNTIKQNLKGDITCKSESHVGTQFVILLPEEI